MVPKEIMKATLSLLALGALLVVLGGCGSSKDQGPVPSAPTITGQPQSVTVVKGQTAGFAVSATGVPAPAFQWERSTDGSVWTTLPGATTTYSLVAQDSDHGAQFRARISNTQGAVTSASALLKVNLAPVIAPQPGSQSAMVGETLTLSVNATARGTLGFQWRKDGAAIPGATASSFVKPGLMPGDAGSYDVVVTSTLDGTVASATSVPADVTVTQGQPPAFVIQPVALAAVVVGQRASFSVTTTGAPAPTFRWERSRQEGPWEPVAGATAAECAFTVGAEHHNTRYRVWATNQFDSIVSTSGRLLVNVAPAFQTHPLSQTKAEGGSITFDVQASAHGDVSYQWRKEGVALPGAIYARLSKEALSASDAGCYDVVVTSTLHGTVASASSNPAVLTIVGKPVITAFEPERRWVSLGQSARLLATFSGGEGTVDQEVGPVTSGKAVSTSPLHAPTTYTLRVTNEAGESVSASTTVYGPSPLAVGNMHTSALKADGTLWTWGYNGRGYLGDGGRWHRSIPGVVPGLQNVLATSFGAHHSVAVTADGNAWAWGSNLSGQLGHTSVKESPDPLRVSGVEGIATISAGGEHTLALRTDGTVWSWGANSRGQVGHGGLGGISVPAAVAGISDVVALAAGQEFSLVLKADGTVWAWGDNARNQLGDGTATLRLTPIQVPGLSNVVTIAAGREHALALKGDGSVWAWGSNLGFQLGIETIGSQASPIRISGISDVVALAGGSMHSLALKSDGSVWAWGTNFEGQAGIGPSLFASKPSPVIGISDACAIGARDDESLALTSDGSLWAWGSNEYGHLGEVLSFFRTTPQRLHGLDGVVSVAGGDGHSLALTSGGAVWAWGTNRYGQLGDGTTSVGRSEPFLVSEITKGVSLAAGYLHSLVRDETGMLWGFGGNYQGQLGFPTSTYHQCTPLANPLGAMTLASGSRHSLAWLPQGGTPLAWGYNWDGQLGDGTNTNRGTAVPVSGLPDVVAMAAGDTHTLALRADGTVWSWGGNLYGQLGDGTKTAHPAPAPVPGLTDILALAAGTNFSLALTKDGRVWSWGANHSGQLGDNSTAHRVSPVLVPGLTHVSALAAGRIFSMALKTDGTVWAWGSNEMGQLGDSTLTGSPVPVPVAGLNGVVSIAAGGYHACAAKSDGSLWTWGFDGTGQLGSGRKVMSAVPNLVPDFKLW